MKPEISIIVVTYNSSKYITQTLESIKNQTYRNFELIITDDNSTDDTIDKCYNWIKNNQVHLDYNAKIITTQKNTGVTANCNRGVKASQGIWLKFIAGDDLLIPDSINKFISHLNKSKQPIYFLFSNIFAFNNNGEHLKSYSDYFNNNSSFFSLEPHKQYQHLLKFSSGLAAPSSIINKEKLVELNCFDEEIPHCEDYPLWLKATKAGYKLHYMPNLTVKYRSHSENITNSSIPNSSKILIFRKYKSKDLAKLNFFIWLDQIMDITFSNKSGILKYIRYFSPYLIIAKFLGIGYFKNK